jgi:hypothetical protein
VRYFALICFWAVFWTTAAAAAAVEAGIEVPDDKAADSTPQEPPPKPADDSSTEALPPTGSEDSEPAEAPRKSADDAIPDSLASKEAVDPATDAPETAPKAESAESSTPAEPDDTEAPSRTGQPGPEPRAEKKAPPSSRPLLFFRPDSGLTLEVLQEYDHQYKRNAIMQSMGYSMLAVSFVMEVVGSILTQVSPQGRVGVIGIGFVGGGLVHFVTSAFLLAFSVPPDRTPPPGRIQRSNRSTVLFTM